MRRKLECRMIRSRLLIAASVLAAAVPVAAKVTAVKALQTWTGSMPANLQPLFQQSLATPADLQRVWTTCQVKGVPPRIDFGKQLVLLAVRRNSGVTFAGLKLEDGNLKTNIVVTPDTPNHFTCKLVLVDRAGVTSVNGSPVGN